MAQSSQKFIARSRSPRVRIEYDVELYGAEKRVEVPFVLGVLADLAGSPARPPPSLEERRMLQIDIDNFDDRLRATEPRVAFSVPSALVDGENLDVDITFTCMDDFAPAAVANKVAGPDLLLKQRTQLTHLVAYMDGKHGASQLVERLLNDQSLLEQIAAKGERSPDYGANTAAGDFVKMLWKSSDPDRTPPYNRSRAHYGHWQSTLWPAQLL